VRAAARPDNAASLAVLARHGFEAVGEQEDDEDGLEIVHEVALPATGSA
jgi:RimJ/RimL family protein N-acetyltransferase